MKSNENNGFFWECWATLRYRNPNPCNGLEGKLGIIAPFENQTIFSGNS